MIGVINKTDLSPENEEICIRQMNTIGVDEPYFKVSITEGKGIEELKTYLLELKERYGGYYEVHN